MTNGRYKSTVVGNGLGLIYHSSSGLFSVTTCIQMQAFGIQTAVQSTTFPTSEAMGTLAYRISLLFHTIAQLGGEKKAE